MSKDKASAKGCIILLIATVLLGLWFVASIYIGAFLGLAAHGMEGMNTPASALAKGFAWCFGVGVLVYAIVVYFVLRSAGRADDSE